MIRRKVITTVLGRDLKTKALCMAVAGGVEQRGPALSLTQQAESGIVQVRKVGSYLCCEGTDVPHALHGAQGGDMDPGYK